MKSLVTPSGDSLRSGHESRGPSFSLVELVIVVVIIGVLSAIAAPRFSRAAGSATAAYVDGTVSAVRRAMGHYYAEHAQYPGADPDTGTPDQSDFVNQLLLYSDQAGHTSATRVAPFIYGPYLRPPFPVNPFSDLDTVGVKGVPSDPIAIGTTGWIAVLSDGDFGINATVADLDRVDLDKEKVRIKGSL